MHYYQFNIGDYRKDTTHLLPIEHYIYRTLIDWYYLDEMPIPKETQVVLRRLRLGNENEENLKFVLSDFFKLHDDGWHQSRIDEDIINYHSKANANRANGALGGRPKKTQVVISGIANANRSESEINPNQEPLTNNHKPTTINQEPIKNINEKNVNDECNIVSAKYAPKKGTALTNDWVLPKAWGEWAMAERPDFTYEEVKKMSEAFKDHWVSTSNQAKSKRADWLATWRNWVRNQKKFSNTSKTKFQQIQENNRKAGEEFLKDFASAKEEKEVFND